MEFLAGAGAVGASGAAGVFEYNRANFVYDRKMRQETEHKIMDFRIKQAELWREDVRDIIGLTAVKMDTYLVLNTVQLGFCVMAFCEGRLAHGTPSWLIGCHTLSLAGAFMYLLMSVWLAMHASVTAKSYEVRLLTQLVRLPIPTWSQIEGARTYSSSFEKVNSKQMFRVPFASGSQESVLRQTGTAPLRAGSHLAPAGLVSDAAPASTQPSDLWGLEAPGEGIYELDGRNRIEPDQLRHLRLVREATKYWQSYDGFARVSMSMGTNQLITAMAYYVLAYVLIANRAVIAAFLAVGLFMAIAAALIRLDMSLTAMEYRTAVVLVVSGPALTAFGCERWLRDKNHADADLEIDAMMPLVYVFHATWLLFLLYISKVREQNGGALLPTGFRSVMYIDVFGWIKKADRGNRITTDDEDESAIEEGLARNSLQAPVPPRTTQPGFGPAMEAVGYDAAGRPVPMRPEALPGSAQPVETSHVKEEDFAPTTFVPQPKSKDAAADGGIHQIQPLLRPGLVPWRIFCSATVLLISLWWLVGVAVFLDSTGRSLMTVRPLFDEPEADEAEPALTAGAVDGDGEEPAPLLLSGGRLVPTRWPHAGVRPQGFSCGGDMEDGHGPWAVASTRFGLLASRLPREVADSDPEQAPLAGTHAVFKGTPACEEVEGESLQDVSLHCVRAQGANATNQCSALVLHRQGQRLSSCPLSGSSGPAAASAGSYLPAPPGHLAVAWLQEADGVVGQPQEEITAFALGGAACGKGARERGSARDGSASERSIGGSEVCGYAETTGGRLVELQAGVGSTGWFPTRVLQARLQHRASPHQPGSGDLSLAGTSARYLLVLHPQSKVLEAIDLHGDKSAASAADTAGNAASTADSGSEAGQSVGQWLLPRDQEWSAACSAGNSIYMLADGASPQLWRFSLPTMLRDVDERDAAPSAASGPQKF